MHSYDTLWSTLGVYLKKNRSVFVLPAWFIIFSIAIRLTSGGQYLWGVLKGRARPNPITWLLWGCTAMIAFAAQVSEGVGVQALVTFALGLSPLVIFTVAVIKYPLKAHLTPFTIICAIFAIIGIVLWQVTSDAGLAIIFSIIADIFACLPTLLKAYRDPSSEYGQPYLLSVISMAVLLLTIQTWTFAAYAFPLYMLCINIVLYVFATVAIKKRVRAFFG